MEEIKAITVGVFRGGIAAEREVSLESGAAVRDALIRKGYVVVDCVVDSDKKEYIEDIIKSNKIDLVFIVMHGEFGEDGQLQCILDELGIKYTGSGKQASYNAMDKIRTHEVLANTSIPMPAYEVIKSIKEVSTCKIGLPCVVKPYYAGSSIGVYLARTEQEFEESVTKALEISNKALVEDFVQGREFTVGIVGSQVLPVVEISPNAEFYDYESKYEAQDTGFVVPAQLDDRLTKNLQNLGIETYKALECSGAARVDILLDKCSKAYVLELNSIPGMTSHSLLPLAAAKSGLSFDDLCDKIVRLSF